MKKDGKVTTATDESLKRPWQTPEIIEEDYRETEAAPGPAGGLDMAMYS